MKRKAAYTLCFKSLLGILLWAVFSQSASAQTITNYTFTASTATFTALSGATAATLATGSTDDGVFNALPIGFDFWYMGVRYTTISPSTNGWLAPGSTITDDNTNGLSARGTRPLIAPLWDDLDVVSAANVSYQTTGTAGSRIFTIQYLNVKWNYQASGAVSSFQVKFYETTGKIEFIYRSDAGGANTPTASIGITALATGSGNFLSVNNAGTSVSSTIEASVTTKPISGRTYGFTPPTPTAPTNLTFSAISGTSTTLNWTDNSSNESGFVIYRSTDATNYSFVSQTAAGATSSLQSGLSGATTYYWRVYAVSVGRLSTVISGSQITACTGPNISQLPATNLISYYKFEGNANDAAGNNTGTLQGAPALTSDRFGNANKAYNFNGTSQYISTANAYVNPSAFSVSIRFKTTTSVGGALIGFETVQIGNGDHRDRFIYMTSTGTLYFAVAPGAVKKYVTTPLSYNDGNWHMATGTVGAGGLKLYVDGILIVTDATTTSAENYTGYWRIGYNNLGTWPSEPSSYYFAGILDDALIYHRELNSTEIGALYNSPDGAGSDAPVCVGSSLNLTAKTVAGATYSWTGPNGFTSSSQNPSLTYAAAYAGIYIVQVTAAGCATPSVAYVNVTTPVSNATISYAGSPYCTNGGTAVVTLTGATGGTYSSTAGLSVNASTGAVNLAASIAGTYTVTYAIAGGCSTTSTIVITTAAAATISYSGTPYCTSTNTATVTFSGTTGGTYTSATGLVINGITGEVNLSASTAGSYTVTYTITASGACSVYTTTAAITINNSPAISQIPGTNLIAYYKFDGNANDATGNNNGTLQNSPAPATNRFGIVNSAYTLNGSSQYISTTNAYVNPADITVSIWFKTSTVTGGKLIGFGREQLGSSGQFDRHIYMNNAGQIYFGVYNGVVSTVNSALSYNDNNWHLATATLSSATGIILYIDGVQAGSNAAVTTGENYTGYWKIGFGNLSGWTSSPSGSYFSGLLDDALIYHRALNAGEVAILYKSPDGAGNNGPACAGTSLSLSTTAVPGATYAWTGPNAFTSSTANPSFTYAIANNGTYKVVVTGGGCTATAYTNVVSSTDAGQWTGNVSTDWATGGNWCTGVVPAATANVIISAGAARMPSVTTSVSCNNLTIATGATIITSGTGTLNIGGILTNNGTFTSTGTTNFNGTTGQQTFSGVSQFYNLTVTNTAGLLQPASITVNNTLTIATGILNTNNFNLTIKGNWVNNASAAALTAGTSTVTFNGTIAQSIGGTFATTFNNLIISNAGNIVSLLVNISVSGNLSVAAGTFDLTVFTANRLSTGGTLLVSNNATLKIGGTNTFPSNFTTNTLVVSSTVEYEGLNQTVANQVYGNLTLSSSAGVAVKTSPATALSVLGNLTTTQGTGTSVSFTAAAVITVGGIVTIGAATTFNGGSYIHSIGGNWLNSGTFTGSTSTIIFTGAGTTVGGTGAQNFNNLTVAGSAVVFSNAGITITGNLATTGSGSFSQASGGTLTMSGSSKTISGSSISLDNLTVSGIVTTAISFNLTGNLIVSGSFTASNGTITMSGIAKSISGAGTIGFSNLSATGVITTSTNFSVSSSLNVNGSFTASAGTVTFTGSSTLSGIANLYNTTINGTSLQITSNSTLAIANLLTITAGVLDVTTSIPNTVNFNGTGAQNINNITYNKLILSNGNNKTASGAITVNNDIIIGTGTTFISGAYTHTCYNNWINNGAFTAGSGTITFSGTATTNIIGATTFNILTINNATPATEIILQSNVSAATVNMITGIIFTGSNTLTITTTRTGNGIIIGTIQRTHAFSAGVAYAFEGPANTITFASLSGISSVTVNVIENTPGDFPFSGSVNRVYNITIPAGTYNATLRLHYEDNELNGNNESSMGLWRYNGTTWTALGKTGNDASLNYVEHSGLTDVTNRWTLSDNSNVVQWNGSVSTDWNTAANWTVLQGAASAPPAATDIVDLGTATFNFHPTISTAVTVKNIVFGSVQALNLSMASGGSLTSGTINGIWSSNLTHNINVNNQTITINGDLSLSDGTTGHAINLNAGTGTVSVLGSLTESGGANISFSGAGTLNILENFNYSNGTFTAGSSSTVVYNGVINQTIGAVAYHNLTINKASGLATINQSSIAGNLIVAGGELNNFAATTITGDVTISSGAIFNNFDTLHVGGNWINNGTYSASGGNIFFDGTGAQSISSSTFNNLHINKASGTATLTGNVLINGNLIVSAGTLDLGIYSGYRTTPGGFLSVANGATVMIGNDTQDPGFSVLTFGITSTIVFNANIPQTLILPGIDFGNLTLSNTGIKTLAADISIRGNLVIDNTTTVDGAASNISLGGNWTNNGTFIPGTSTLLLQGTSKTINGNTTFNKVTISGSYTQLSTSLTYNDLLYITPTGSIAGGTTIFTTLNGDLLNQGSLITSGTTTFTGLQLQTLSLINATTFALTVFFNGTVSPILNSTSAPQYGFLNINNTGGINASVGYTIAYALNIGSGASFNGGPSTHNILGAVNNDGTITSSGSLNFIPTTTASVNLGSNFSSTGLVVFGGAAALNLSGTPQAFHDVFISNTNAAGITATSGWNLSNRLTVNNGAIFNAGSYTDSVGGNILINGILNAGTSTFVLNGTGNQDISSASAFNNFTLNKTTGTANLLRNATVNGVLNFVKGNITTGDNQVALSASGAVSGAAQNTGWVFGNLKKNITTGATAKTYEIGDGTNYVPVVIAFSNVSTAGDLMATTIAGDHPDISSSVINPAGSVNRYWTLTNSGIVFNNYSSTFNFKTTDVDAGAITSNFGVGLYNGSSWVMPVTAVSTTTSSQATGITSFGSFAIGEICNAGTGITYSASPYCTSAGSASVTLTGTSGGSYSSTTGLSLNTTTGTITLATSTPGTYGVTYTVAASGSCATYITSANITITKAPDATIAYTSSPYFTGSGTATVTLSDTLAGGTYSSTAGLSIDATTGNVTLSTSTAGTYTVTYTVAAVGGCALYSTTATIVVTTFKTWDGGAGTNNWEDAANWQPDGVPTMTENVRLTGTNAININANAVTRNLVLNNTGVLTINAGNLSVNNITVTAGILNINTNTIRIAGTIANSGTFIAGNGTVEMNGSSAQVIPVAAFTGNTLNGLIVSNSAGVTLNGTVLLSGVLLANGPLNANGYLTLISTAAQTALIDGTGSGEVLGIVTMQRYLTSGFGYKYFSSPFLAATVNEFSDDIDLGASFPVFYRYNENMVSSGFVNYSDKTGMLDPMMGYTANLGPLLVPRTISITGVVNNNTIAPVALYNNNQPYTLGFNLVGNPYPSPVDWDLSAGWDRSNIDDAVYYFDAGITDQYRGTYSSYINGVSSDGIAGHLIAAMQGFFIHVSDGTYPVTATLGINNSARVNNLVANFHRDPAPVTAPLLRITAGFPDKRIIADPVVVYFDKAATRAFEPAMDALKLMNTDSLVPNLYALSSNAKRLSICAWPAMEDSSDIIPLGLQTKQSGWVTFNATSLERIPAGRHIYLYDNKTGTRQDLQMNPQYRVMLEAGEYDNRFSLVFSSRSSVPVSAGIFDAYGAGSKIYAHITEMAEEKCDVTVTNMNGQVILRRKLYGNGYHELGSRFSAGIYIVSFYVKQRVISKKVFISN